MHDNTFMNTLPIEIPIRRIILGKELTSPGNTKPFMKTETFTDGQKTIAYQMPEAKKKVLIRAEMSHDMAHLKAVVKIADLLSEEAKKRSKLSIENEFVLTFPFGIEREFGEVQRIVTAIQANRNNLLMHSNLTSAINSIDALFELSVLVCRAYDKLATLTDSLNDLAQRQEMVGKILVPEIDSVPELDEKIAVFNRSAADIRRELGRVQAILEGKVSNYLF